MNEALCFKQDPVHEFFDIGGEIGSGQFAVVKTCIEKATGTEFAAKFMKKRRSKTSRRGVSLEQITREANVLRSINHGGIIYLHEIYETKLEFVLILELLSGGELFEFLSEQEYLTEDEAVGFTIQVIQAIGYLHEQSIVHLDIKPENIVLKNRTQPLTLKLIDFGLARKITKGETIREMMGTPEFVAPEVIEFEPVGLPSDMWSIGVLTYIMLSGASPFLGDDNGETFSNISHVDYEFDDEYFKDISDSAKDFISSLLIKEVSERLTAVECLAHAWLEEEVCPITTRTGTPSAAAKKRRSTMIKTDAFKAFTARARWKKSLNKVIAVSRIAMLGRKNGPLAKELMLQVYDSQLEPPEFLAEICEEDSVLQECEVEDDWHESEEAAIRRKSVACAEHRALALEKPELDVPEENAEITEDGAHKLAEPSDFILEMSPALNEITKEQGSLENTTDKTKIFEVAITESDQETPGSEKSNEEEKRNCKSEDAVILETVENCRDMQEELCSEGNIELGKISKSTEKDKNNDIQDDAGRQPNEDITDKLSEKLIDENANNTEKELTSFGEYKQVVSLIEDHIIKPFDYEIIIPYKETSV